MTAAWAGELEFGIELARRAGALVRDSYQRVETVNRKSRRDVVTEVDYRSEALLVDAIRDRYPADGTITEEAGSGGAEQAARVWVIDPLDGTINYVNGIPYFSVAIALVADGQPVVGMVFDPLRDDLYTATAGGPAQLNGHTVRASSKGELGDYVVSLAIIGPGGLARERAIAREIRIHRRMGSAALSLASVANGRFDAFVQNGGLSRWDVAAAGLIAERGGATVTDLAGGPWWDAGREGPTMNVVAAPQPQHGELLRLLAAAGTRVRARR